MDIYESIAQTYFLHLHEQLFSPSFALSCYLNLLGASFYPFFLNNNIVQNTNTFGNFIGQTHGHFNELRKNLPLGIRNSKSTFHSLSSSRKAIIKYLLDFCHPCALIRFHKCWNQSELLISKYTYGASI